MLYCDSHIFYHIFFGGGRPGKNPPVNSLAKPFHFKSMLNRGAILTLRLHHLFLVGGGAEFTKMLYMLTPFIPNLLGEINMQFD